MSELLYSPFIPADVPLNTRATFVKNYNAITRETGKLFLFAADHKIEHLDTDFLGPHIDPAAHHPEHIFAIAQHSKIGALATQLGLIARYGQLYPSVNYIAKLNSKTNLGKEKDPLSRQLWDMDDVLPFISESKLPIRGVGLTVYIGSEYEDIMLYQAAQTIVRAHRHGLVTIIWMYPRGKAVSNETDIHLLAGAAGVAACLGADFVKIHPPQSTATHSSASLLKTIIEAAGNTKVICAGGKQQDPEALIQEVRDQITIGGTAGAAIGRNIYQHSLADAVIITNQLAALIFR